MAKTKKIYAGDDTDDLRVIHNTPTYDEDPYVNSIIETAIKAGGFCYLSQDEYNCDLEYPKSPKKPFLDLRTNPSPDDLRKYADDVENFQKDLKEFNAARDRYNVRNQYINQKIQKYIFNSMINQEFIRKFPNAAKKIESIAWGRANADGFGFRSYESELESFSDLIEIILQESK